MRCEVIHCTAPAAVLVEVCVGEVWLCEHHDRWEHLPPLKREVEEKK